MNLADLVIIVTVVWGAWFGCRKGLIISLSKLVGYILGLIAAVAFYKPLANLLGSVMGLDKIFSRIASVVMHLPANLRNVPIKSLSMTKVQQISGSINIPDAYQKYLHEMINQLGIASKRGDVSTIGDALNHMAGGVILQLVTFIILMFAVERAIAILSRILSKAMHYTPVGIVDQGGGLVLGAARSFVLIAITLLIIDPILPIGLLSKGPVETFCKEVGNSQISIFVVDKLK